ncbi:MAG: hypothetical protein GXP45_02825 [bacterium]|nr:hypothetical protein [bacterium]
MKKFILVLALTISVVSANSQINLHFGDKITVKPYAGILSGTAFSVDSLSTGGFTSFRLGAIGVYNPTKWLGFTARTTYEVGVFHEESFNLDIKPIGSLYMRIGYMATLTCFQRPDIVSASGQFETWTESQIPGGALGGDLRYLFDNGDLGVGIYDRNGLEYQARISYNKFTLSGSYNTESLHWSAQASWAGDLLYTVFVVQDSVVANISIFNIKKFSLYNDVGYYYNSHNLPRWEFGLLRNFSHEKYPLAGLFGLGYAHEQRAIMAYLFIHLTSKDVSDL